MIKFAGNQADEIARSEEAANLAAVQGIRLVTLIKTIQIDIIQVQQWLTDISATRGLDDLADGFDKAAEAAANFQTAAREAATLAGTMDLPAALAAIKAVEAAFPPYYDMGRQMAKGYIAEGPAGGNPMMENFDQAAERLGGEMETLVSLTTGASDAATADLLGQLHAIRQAANRLAWLMTGLGGMGVAIGGLLIVMVRRKVVRPLKDMTSAMVDMSLGRLDILIPGTKSRDEIGAMGSALEIFRANALENEKLRADAERQRREAYWVRHESLEAMAARIENDMTKAVDMLAMRTGEVDVNARQMAGSADLVNSRSHSVAAAAAQALSNAEHVAAATEQLTSSIGEIGAQVASAGTISRSAVRTAPAPATPLRPCPTRWGGSAPLPT